MSDKTVGTAVAGIKARLLPATNGPRPEYQNQRALLDHAAIDQKIRNGDYPESIPYQLKAEKLVPVPAIFLRFPLFHYGPKRPDQVYTLDHPLIMQTGWGRMMYAGSQLTQRDLSVLMALQQTAGGAVLRGPRKSFSSYYIDSGRGKNVINLEMSGLTGKKSKESNADYQTVEMLYGSTTIYRICNYLDWSICKKNYETVREALLKLWDARFYVEYKSDDASRKLPDWLREDLPDSEKLAELSDEEKPGLGSVDDNADLNELLQSGASKKYMASLTQHKFFDLICENNAELSGEISVVFSPFYTFHIRRRATFLDMNVRLRYRKSLFAQALIAFLCSQTNRKYQSYRIGLDRLMPVLGYWQARRKKNKETKETARVDIKKEAEKEVVDIAQFRRLVTQTCLLLEDKEQGPGFLENWSTKPLRDPRIDRKTDVMLWKRFFDSP